MLMPWLTIQWFAITKLALEARQHILQSCNAAYVLSTGSHGVLAVFPLSLSLFFCIFLSLSLLSSLSVCLSHSLNHTKTNQGQKYCSLALFLQLITRQCMLNLHLLAGKKITPRSRITALIWKTWRDKRELIRTWGKRKKKRSGEKSEWNKRHSSKLSLLLTVQHEKGMSTNEGLWRKNGLISTFWQFWLADHPLLNRKVVFFFVFFFSMAYDFQRVTVWKVSY